jgi:multidrug resistance efflux pump
MNPKAIVAVLVLAGAGAGLWAWRSRKTDDSLRFSGTVEARDVEVGSLMGGRVAAVQAREGQTVTAGQPLVTFETDMVDLQVKEQEAQVAQAKAALALVLEGPRDEVKRRAEVEYENAERDRRRLESLQKEGIVPRQAYDDAAAKAAMARESLREAQRGSRPEDVEAARAAVARESSRLDYLRRQKAESVVTAPTAGTVETLDLRPGDLVGAGRPVATLLEPHQLWVRVYVPEPRLGAVHLGQAAAVAVDTFPDRRFAGRVVEIADRAEYTPRNVQTYDQRSEQVFGVKVEIDPAPEVKAGMAADVRLVP